MTTEVECEVVSSEDNSVVLGSNWLFAASAKPPGSYEAVKGLTRPYKVAASLAQTARLAVP